MKLPILFLAIVCIACNSSDDPKDDEAAITKLLNDETHFAAKGDSTNWASCWVNSDDASFTITTADGTQSYSDYNSLAREIAQVNPFDLKLTRSNYDYVIGDEVAFVSFDQQDNWGGIDRKTKETRALRKINGDWKIVHANIVDLSSTGNQQTGSFHMDINKIPKNPKTGFNNISGLGGMSINYVQIAAPADFTPLFEGLPGNMCPSPHWGYILEGSVRVRYGDGKEETLNAGEVCYTPAPHTAVVDKNLKFIDFSPDSKFVPLMEHMAKKMAKAPPK